VPTIHAALVMVGTLRFAHPTDRELICLTRKRDFTQLPATNQHDGQISQNLSSPVCKNIPLNLQAKSPA
jgi:hypothetical protein